MDSLSGLFAGCSRIGLDLGQEAKCIARQPGVLVGGCKCGPCLGQGMHWMYYTFFLCAYLYVFSLLCCRSPRFPLPPFPPFSGHHQPTNQPTTKHTVYRAAYSQTRAEITNSQGGYGIKLAGLIAGGCAASYLLFLALQSLGASWCQSACDPTFQLTPSLLFAKLYSQPGAPHHF